MNTAIIPAPRHDLAPSDGQADPASRWEAAAADWLATRKSDRTRRTYAAALRRFLVTAGCEPWEVTRAHVARYALELQAAGLRDATRAAYLAGVSAFYHHAKTLGIIDRNPAEGVPRPTVEPYGRAVALTRHQLDAVLKHPNRATVDGRRDYAMLVLETTTGLRRAELVNIRRQDLTETPAGDIVLTYRPKGGDQETRPLPRVAVSALREYLTDRGPLEGSDPVFVAHDRGAHTRQARPLTAEAWRNIVTKYTRAALGFRVHPHALRHSVGTELWKHTHDLKKVQRMLGHKHVTTTQRYIDHVEDDRARLGDELAALFGVV